MHCPRLGELPSPVLVKSGLSYEKRDIRQGWPWTEESPQLPDTMSDGQPWPKISVITPSYNQGLFLEETIRSVLLQGYPNLEYIIIDGGSTDNSVQVIKKYEKWLAYWVSKPDKGQSDAINQGFRIAKGDLVSWINSDDLYFPETFSKIARNFQKYPEADFVYGDGDVIDERGELKLELLSRSYDLSILKSYHFMTNNTTNFIIQQSVFWRFKVFDKIGLLDDSLHYGMDYEYWLRAGTAGLSFVHIPEKIGKYRMISGTKTMSNPTIFWNERLEIFRRYNSKRMKRFFIYYFYNKLLHNNFSAEGAWQEIAALFENRWNVLDVNEQAILKKEAEIGYCIGLIKGATDAFIQRDSNVANTMCKTAFKKRPLLRAHPLYISFILYKLFGKSISAYIRRFFSRLAFIYYLARYRQRYLTRNFKKIFTVQWTGRFS